MTETRAPFNGKKKELLLIQIPMSAENVMTVRKHIMSQCVTNDAIVNGIRAIGTPVQDGDLNSSRECFEAFYAEMCANATGCKFVTTDYVRGLRCGDNYGSRPFLNYIWEAWPNFVAYALAKLAERDAEIAKLREYYAANEDINRVGLFFSTREMFNRMNKACAALKGPEA